MEQRNWKMRSWTRGGLRKDEGEDEEEEEEEEEVEKKEEKEYKEVQRNTKEEQTATVLLDLTKMSVWLHYYYNIYLTETKGHQSGRLLPIHPSLQPKLAGRGSDTM